ncbi:MAG: tetratricopeptide repeat protein [Candidatus Krumholzibacteriia bacterium]
MTRMRSLCLSALLLLMALAGCRSAQTTSAILYMEQQKYDKAVKVLHEALEYNPDEADAFFYLGEAHSKLAEVAISENNFAEARRNYEMAYGYYVKARTLKPAQFKESVDLAVLHNYTLRNNDAKTEYQGRYYEAAEGFFRLAYAALPDSIAPIRNIAVMKIKQAGENNNDPAILGEALTLIDEVLKQRPGAYDLLADKANVLAKLGRSDEAAKIYDDLLREHGDDTALLIDMTNLAVQDGKYERAAELSTRLIDLLEKAHNPENDAQIKNLMVQSAGWLAQRDVHRYPEALELYKRALQFELVPEQETMVGRLLTLYDYGNYLKKQAAEAADPAAKAEFESQAMAQYKEGVAVGTEAVDAFFDCANCYLLLARCQFETGDYKGGEASTLKYNELQASSGGSGGGGQ